MIAGVLVKEWKPETQARRKRLRAGDPPVIPMAALMSSLNAYRRAAGDPQGFSDAQRSDLLRQAVAERMLKSDFLEPLRDEIMRGLSFVHDYKQINSQIVQNINVILETRYPGGSIDEKLGRATQAEKAIYESARFLEEKLNVAKFLIDPAWLDARDACARFRVHGLVHKYVKIYQSQFAAKGVNLSFDGVSTLECQANPDACGVIPHTLLDNAQKYSRRRGYTRVTVDDKDEGVLLRVESLGPKIEVGEMDKVFWPFYRGVNARKLVDEGAGYGLYVSQLIAERHLGAKIELMQEGRDSGDGEHVTVFSVIFPERAKILE